MKLPWWGFALLLVAAGLWLERHDAALRAEAALLVTQDSLVAAREQRDAADRARLEADKLAKRNLAEREERIAWAELRRDSLKAAAAVAIAELRAVVPPAQRIYVDNLERNQKALTATADSIITDRTTQRDTLLVMYQRADSAAMAWKLIAEKWEAQSTAWEKKARPGLLEQVRRAAPWLAVGLVVGFVLR